MAYKDRDKQRAYQRDWVRRRRLQGSTGSTEQPDTNGQVVNAGEAVFKAIKDKAQNIRIKSSFSGPLTKEKQTSRKGFNE
jgi:hypothetical protein